MIMDSWGNYFLKREKRQRRCYEIEDRIYTLLETLSEIYEASISDIINICIDYLSRTEKIALYERPADEIVVRHTLYITEKNIKALDRMKETYGISIFRLVNMAIKVTLDDFNMD